MNESPYMTFKEFCEYLRIGETKGRELTQDPRNKFVVRIGRTLRIHKGELIKWEKTQMKVQ